jgi:hypothetical protein
VVRGVDAVRDYSSVTIFEARTRWTGKLRLTQHAKDVAAECARDLVAHYGDGVGARRVLIVMAKDSSKGQEARGAFERTFAGAGFAEVAITNWGRVDGQNEWKDFDTLLLASLHYGSNTQDVNAYLAIAGVAPDDDTLNAVDEVKVIRERRIAASVAQAIGRLRLRTMSTPDGRCAPCDVWVRLPNTNIVIDVDAVTDAVAQTLPGVVRVPWTSASRRAPRPGRARNRRDLDQRIVAYLDALPGDVQRIEANHAREALDIKTSTFARALQRLTGAPPIGWDVDRPAVAGRGRESFFRRVGYVAPPPVDAEKWSPAFARLLALADTAANGGELELTAAHQVGDWHRALRLARQDGHRLQRALAVRGYRVVAGGYTRGVRGQGPARLVRIC